MLRISQVQSLFCAVFALASLGSASVVRAEDTPPKLGVQIELNALQALDGSCRLSFLAQNAHTTSIKEAVYETVLFDTSGGVMMLTLFDFQDLPSGRPRVRQFDLPGVACDSVGRVLVNGAHHCVSDGDETSLCEEGLTLTSRTKAELIG